jgi:hypothetical protein
LCSPTSSSTIYDTSSSTVLTATLEISATLEVEVILHFASLPLITWDLKM